MIWVRIVQLLSSSRKTGAHCRDPLVRNLKMQIGNDRPVRVRQGGQQASIQPTDRIAGQCAAVNGYSCEGDLACFGASASNGAALRVDERIYCVQHLPRILDSMTAMIWRAVWV